jgi:hypothetical protein
MKRPPSRERKKNPKKYSLETPLHSHGAMSMYGVGVQRHYRTLRIDGSWTQLKLARSAD